MADHNGEKEGQLASLKTFRRIEAHIGADPPPTFAGDDVCSASDAEKIGMVLHAFRQATLRVGGGIDHPYAQTCQVLLQVIVDGFCILLQVGLGFRV